MNRSIWSIDGTLQDYTAPGPSGSDESTDNEGVLYIPKDSRIGASLPNAVY